MAKKVKVEVEKLEVEEEPKDDSVSILVKERTELLDLLDEFERRGFRDLSALQARLSVVNRDLLGLGWTNSGR